MQFCVRTVHCQYRIHVGDQHNVIHTAAGIDCRMALLGNQDSHTEKFLENLGSRAVRSLLDRS